MSQVHASPAQNSHMRNWGRGHGYALGFERANEVSRGEPTHEDLLWFAERNCGMAWTDADVAAFRGGMADGKGSAS